MQSGQLNICEIVMVKATVEGGTFLPWGPSIRHHQVEPSRYLWKLCDSEDLLTISEPTNITGLIVYLFDSRFYFMQVTEQTILESIEEDTVFDSLLSIQKHFGIHTAPFSNQGLLAVCDDSEAIESLLKLSGVKNEK